MNARHFQRINPNFKFNRIFLYNQAGFNNNGSMKKFLFPLQKDNSNNKYMEDIIETKNIDYITRKFISKYRDEIKGMNDFNYNNDKKMLVQSLKKKNNIKLLRPKLLQSGHKLKKIDFNTNSVSDDLNDSLELNINHYISGRDSKDRYLSLKKRNNIQMTELNTYINQLNTNNDTINKISTKNTIEFSNLKLPKIIKNNYNNSSSFNTLNDIQKMKIGENSVENNKTSNINNNNNEENRSKENDKVGNKKKNEIVYNDDIMKINEGKIYESKMYIKSKNPYFSPNNKMLVDILNDDELLKRKEKDKYIVFEKSKKFIEKNKIYEPMKHGAASIPNLSLDKSFRSVKKMDSVVKEMKNEKIELPFCNK